MKQVVLGVDSSTQATKVIAVDLEAGEVLAIGRAPHSGLHTQNPTDWWKALRVAVAQVAAPDQQVVAISVSGQQHGLVATNGEGVPVMPAPLWNNQAAAADAEWLNSQADFAAEVGSRLVSSFTIAKVAHVARNEPSMLGSIEAICLPHDWLTWQLTGRLISDRGDASGTGWWSPISESTRRDLLQLAAGKEYAARVRLPEILGPNDQAGTLSIDAAGELGLPPGIPVGCGSGDNMAAALGVAATPGHYVVSLGTSGTAYAVSDEPTADPSGEVSGFADATGRYLPLACMVNCTRVIDEVARLTGRSIEEALDAAGLVEPGADGLLLMPYLGGERTPNLPLASGTLLGMSMSNLRPETLARAAVDGVAAGLAYCVEALRRLGIDEPEIVLVGGGSAHTTWMQAIADATQLPVTVLAGREHVALGAAIQAGAIVTGQPVVEVADQWRPKRVARVLPRTQFADRFRLDERQALIEIERARAAISASA